MLTHRYGSMTAVALIGAYRLEGAVFVFNAPPIALNDHVTGGAAFINRSPFGFAPMPAILLRYVGCH